MLSAQKKGWAVENRSTSPRTIVLDDPFSSKQGARLLCQLAADASAKQISLSDLKQVGRSLFDQVMNYDADNLLPVRGLEHRMSSSEARNLKIQNKDKNHVAKPSPYAS